MPQTINGFVCRPDLSLSKQCKLLKISRSSMYYAPVGVNAETLKLMNEIDRVFIKYPFFGSRQTAAYLPRNGFHAGRQRVRRLMGAMGLQAIYMGANTSKKHPQHRVYPYLYQSRAQTMLAQRYHLHSHPAWVLVSGGNHGLGDAQGVVMAAVEHAGRQLLR